MSEQTDFIQGETGGGKAAAVEALIGNLDTIWVCDVKLTGWLEHRIAWSDEDPGCLVRSARGVAHFREAVDLGPAKRIGLILSQAAYNSVMSGPDRADLEYVVRNGPKVGVRVAVVSDEEGQR